MVSISIQLTDEEAARLTERASALSLAPEQLAAAVLRGDLSDDDDEFEQQARRIVAKNRALYERLA